MRTSSPNPDCCIRAIRVIPVIAVPTVQTTTARQHPCSREPLSYWPIEINNVNGDYTDYADDIDGENPFARMRDSLFAESQLRASR